MQALVERLTPERRRELTRTALLDAASDVFARRFHAASLEEIAEAAGFTRGAIYKNFGNKEDLFLAVIERRIEAQLKRFSDAFQEDGATGAMDVDKLAEIWNSILAGDPEWFALDLEFRLYAMRNAEARERWVAHERDFLGLVTRFIKEQGDALGVSIKIPAETMAGIMIPASQGFWQWAFLDPEQSGLYGAFLELVIDAVVERPG